MLRVANSYLLLYTIYTRCVPAYIAFCRSTHPSYSPVFSLISQQPLITIVYNTQRQMEHWTTAALTSNVWLHTLFTAIYCNMNIYRWCRSVHRCRDMKYPTNISIILLLLFFYYPSIQTIRRYAIQSYRYDNTNYSIETGIYEKHTILSCNDLNFFFP